MSEYVAVIKREFKFYMNALRDDRLARKDLEYFRPSGTQVYCGRQGEGKTISAVRHVVKLRKRYPKSILVSNLLINGMTQLKFASEDELKWKVQEIVDNDLQGKYYIYFQDFDDLALALVAVNNDKFGVVYLIDEIHTYFNALESSNIPLFVFTEISQQRKQRKVIIGTSQLFMRMAKPFREQCDNLIICRTHFGLLTTQKAYDGMDLEQDFNGKLIGNKRKSGFFFQSRELRSVFDTFQKVVSGSEQYEATSRIDMQLSSKKKNKIELKNK